MGDPFAPPPPKRPRRRVARTSQPPQVNDRAAAVPPLAGRRRSLSSSSLRPPLRHTCGSSCDGSCSAASSSGSSRGLGISPIERAVVVGADDEPPRLKALSRFLPSSQYSSSFSFTLSPSAAAFGTRSYVALTLGLISCLLPATLARPLTARAGHGSHDEAAEPLLAPAPPPPPSRPTAVQNRAAPPVPRRPDHQLVRRTDIDIPHDDKTVLPERFVRRDDGSWERDPGWELYGVSPTAVNAATNETGAAVPPGSTPTASPTTLPPGWGGGSRDEFEVPLIVACSVGIALIVIVTIFTLVGRKNKQHRRRQHRKRSAAAVAAAAAATARGESPPEDEPLKPASIRRGGRTKAALVGALRSSGGRSFLRRRKGTKASITVPLEENKGSDGVGGRSSSTGRSSGESSGSSQGSSARRRQLDGEMNGRNVSTTTSPPSSSTTGGVDPSPRRSLDGASTQHDNPYPPSSSTLLSRPPLATSFSHSPETTGMFNHRRSTDTASTSMTSLSAVEAVDGDGSTASPCDPSAGSSPSGDGFDDPEGQQQPLSSGRRHRPHRRRDSPPPPHTAPSPRSAAVLFAASSSAAVATAAPPAMTPPSYARSGAARPNTATSFPMAPSTSGGRGASSSASEMPVSPFGFPAEKISSSGGGFFNTTASSSSIPLPPPVSGSSASATPSTAAHLATDEKATLARLAAQASQPETDEYDNDELNEGSAPPAAWVLGDADGEDHAETSGDGPSASPLAASAPSAPFVEDPVEDHVQGSSILPAPPRRWGGKTLEDPYLPEGDQASLSLATLHPPVAVPSAPSEPPSASLSAAENEADDAGPAAPDDVEEEDGMPSAPPLIWEEGDAEIGDLPEYARRTSISPAGGERERRLEEGTV